MLTLRTYGTWLHGDVLGAVDDEHNVYKTPRLENDPQRAGWKRGRMRSEPLVFDAIMRGITEQAIRDECRFRNWELVELAVRTNHVHMVIAYAQITPEEMTRLIKSQVTRALRRAGLVGEHRPVWASKIGSRKYLWTDQDMAGAVLYVHDYQDEVKK